jgi:hypothetical protein
MGTGFRGALICAGLACGALVPASVSAAAPGGRCSPPPRTSKVTHGVISAIDCVIGEARQLRSDVLTEARNAYPGCKEEESSLNPKWKVVEEDGTSIVQFAQVSLPQIAAEDTGVASYLGRFAHAYRDSHHSFLLQKAVRNFNKAKEYGDGFAESMVKAGQALKSHDCARSLDESDGQGKVRDQDAHSAEAEAQSALGELAG